VKTTQKLSPKIALKKVDDGLSHWFSTFLSLWHPNFEKKSLAAHLKVENRPQ
jgi:hypothetical protein